MGARAAPWIVSNLKQNPVERSRKTLVYEVGIVTLDKMWVVSIAT